MTFYYSNPLVDFHDPKQIRPHWASFLLENPTLQDLQSGKEWPSQGLYDKCTPLELVGFGIAVNSMCKIGYLGHIKVFLDYCSGSIFVKCCMLIRVVLRGILFMNEFRLWDNESNVCWNMSMHGIISFKKDGLNIGIVIWSISKLLWAI